MPKKILIKIKIKIRPLKLVTIILQICFTGQKYPGFVHVSGNQKKYSSLILQKEHFRHCLAENAKRSVVHR